MIAIMQGSLIFVSGLSGAGKTTLIRHALENTTNLIYLKTHTTRPRRPGEGSSPEYEFVADDEYEESRRHSKQWDHTEYGGYKYGADVEFIRQRLAQGADVICAVAPNLQVIEGMTSLYGTLSKTIWINTPEQIAQRRIADDAQRASRKEDDSARQYFDYVFEPTGDIKVDCRAFLQLLTDKVRVF